MLKQVLLFISVISITACSSVEVSQERPVEQAMISVQDYKIGVGDGIQIRVWKNPDLSVDVPVRPDGKVSAPLVGDIVAAGKTSEQLAAEIAKTLDSFVRNPQVTVIVADPASADYLSRVRVTGAVKSPQSLSHRQGMTVLDVVLQAGGVTPFAVADGALLYRQTKEGLKVYPVYLEQILEKGRLETNYKLAPSDIITVPERRF